jgi:hypothetical protein
LALTVDDFNQQYQTLNTATNTLMTNYEEQRDAVNKATMLTGYWKTTVIKGLDYTTATHSSVTDENGAFKCQSGENVTFSIASLVLTRIPHKRISCRIECLILLVKVINCSTICIRYFKPIKQNRIANPEVAWQNQLTVVTSALATANTAQANATTTMNNNHNSMPSKFASIEASKQANKVLHLEIQKLDGLKITDANSATVDDFNQQYQTLNTATNTLMTNYEGQRDAACFDASIDANLEGKLLWLLFIVVVAFACAVFAVARELVTTVS